MEEPALASIVEEEQALVSIEEEQQALVSIVEEPALVKRGRLVNTIAAVAVVELVLEATRPTNDLI